MRCATGSGCSVLCGARAHERKRNVAPHETASSRRTLISWGRFSSDGFGKLRDVETYKKLDTAGAFDRPEMPKAELVVDTTDQTPLVSARVIAKHLRPPRKADNAEAD